MKIKMKKRIMNLLIMIIMTKKKKKNKDNLSQMMK